MTEAEFLRCTPRYFEALCKQERMLRRYSERQTAELTAAVINWSMGRPEQPVSAEMFMLTPAEAALVEQVDFDAQLERTMERALRYQTAQVARGIH